MPETTEKITTDGIKIGSTYSVSARRGGLGTPVTTVIKSCVSPVTNPETDIIDETYIGVERPDSLFPLHKGILESDRLIPPTVAIIKKLNVPKGSLLVVAIPALELIKGKANDGAGQGRLKRAIKEALQPFKLVLSPEVYCGAVNALGYFEVDGKRKLKALHSDFIALNLGSTTLEVLVTLHGERHSLNAYTDVCGNMVDHKLHDALQTGFGKVLVTIPQIKELKEGFNMNSPKEITLNVMTVHEGVKQISATKTFQNELDNYVLEVCKTLVAVLKNTLTPETIAQVLDTPIVLTGGMGNIPGLSDRIEMKMRELLTYNKVTVLKQVDGHIAPALGALTLANELNWDKIPPA